MQYLERAKTLGQVLLAATVANLTLVATMMGLMQGRNRGQEHSPTQLLGHVLVLVGTIMVSLSHCFGLTLRTRPATAGFHPGF